MQVGRGAGFDEGAGEGLMFVQVKAEGEVEWALDPVDADLAIALGGVAVAATEERAAVEDGQVEARARAELTHIEIAAEGAGRTGAEGSGLGAGHAHDAGEWADRDDCGGERVRGVGVELPVEKIRVAEVVIEEAEALDQAGPSPAVVAGAEDVDLEDVAGFGSIYI